MLQASGSWSFFALEITKILLKNHAIFLAFTVFSLIFLINFSLSIYSSLSCTPKGTLLLVIFYQLLLFACAGSCTTLCQWFTSIHLYFSAFCFSPVPYFTLCFRHIVLNALTAPNIKILFWGQIKAVQSHYILCSLGTSRFSPPLLW